MRVALLSIHSCPFAQPGSRDTGGMNVYISELARFLSAKRIAVDIFTRIHESNRHCGENLASGVRLMHISTGIPPEADKTQLAYHIGDICRSIGAVVDKESARYDLIHSNYWISGITANRLAPVWGVPHLAMFHTLGAVKDISPKTEIDFNTRIVAEREIVRRCSGIVATTTREKEEIGRLYQAPGDKIRVIPCGIDLEMFIPSDRSQARLRLGWAPDQPVILSVGRIDPVKRLDNVIKAFSLLPFDARLIIVGGSPAASDELGTLKDLAACLGQSERISFLESVPHTLLPQYYTAADITVVASSHESFCLVILESLACGTPVVATPVGVAPDVIRNGWNGEMVENNSPETLVEAISRVLNSGQEKRNYARFSRQSVAGFGWANVGEKILQAYRQLTEGVDRGNSVKHTLKPEAGRLQA